MSKSHNKQVFFNIIKKFLSIILDFKRLGRKQRVILISIPRFTLDLCCVNTTDIGICKF